jgi:hypothetical protein
VQCGFSFRWPSAETLISGTVWNADLGSRFRPVREGRTRAIVPMLAE